MRTNYISTASLLNTPRSTVTRLQAELDKANTESGQFGRYADVGLQIGYRTGGALDIRQGLDDVAAQQQRNGLTTTRLNTAYQALDRARADGEAFMATLTAGKLTDTSATTVAQAATAKLDSFISAMNTQTGGQYLFGGINTGRVPIADYETTTGTTSPAKQAFLDAFQTEFGFAPGTQPQSSAITATQMQNFLSDTGRFAALFSDSQWSTNWSKASDTPVRSEIAPNETVDTSVSANTQPLRQLAMMYSLASSVGLASLASGTQTVVYDKLRSLSGSATWGLTGIQSDVGAVQARITTRGQEMDVQKNILQTGLKAAENGSWEEASARVTSLTTQLQVAYSLTSRVNSLSLINYVQ